MHVLLIQCTVAEYACSVHAAKAPSLLSDSVLYRCVFLCLHILWVLQWLFQFLWLLALLSLTCPCFYELAHCVIAIIAEKLNTPHPRTISSEECYSRWGQLAHLTKLQSFTRKQNRQKSNIDKQNYHQETVRRLSPCGEMHNQAIFNQC